MTTPLIVTVNIPPGQYEALTLLAGGESDFLRNLTFSASQSVARAMQDHLRDYDASHPNKNSWPRSHFVLGLSDDIQLDEASVTADGAAIIASPEVMHKLNGGEIRPKRGKYLAIPATGAAYAAGSPGEGRTPGLTLLLSNKGGQVHAIALAMVEGGPKVAFARAGLDAKIWYWLTAGPVMHQGDPDIIPDDGALQAAAHAGIDEILLPVMEGISA